MKTNQFLIAGLLLAALALSSPRLQAAEATSVDASAPAQVELLDPGTMREVKRLHGTARRTTEQQIRELATWLEKSIARRLPQGESFQVTLKDVDLAGDYEPWRSVQMQDVRVVKDLYPPRIDLSWRRADASGLVISEGETSLRDPAFLQGSGPIGNDVLRHEKRLLQGWLRTVLSQAQ